MLDYKIFAKTIQVLGNYYPKFELTKEQMTTWYKYFQEYDYDQFMYVVQKFIQESSFAPQSPAHLRNGNNKHVAIPPKWMIKQIMSERNHKQIDHKEPVNLEEVKKINR